MNYEKFTYPQLKKECARLRLGGAGNREVLTGRLEAYASEMEGYSPEPEVAPERPEPTFSNWDEDGKWIRRPKDFISWADEAYKDEARKRIE